MQKKIQLKFQTLKTYFADFGAVFFVADAFFILFALIVEFFYPGFVVNYIAPQTMVVFAVFCAAVLFCFSCPGRNMARHRDCGYCRACCDFINKN